MRERTGEMINATTLMDAGELAERIGRGGYFFIAADETVLRRLPKGRWIGGTTPYFMTEKGGVRTREKAYALELPGYLTGVKVAIYDSNTLSRVYRDSPDNGFSLIAIPAASKTHLSFALNAPSYENFAISPLAGWIAGVSVAEIGKAAPLVFDGHTGAAYEDAAVVMHAELPKGRTAVVGIINIFEPSEGDVLTFTENGFSAREALVNGRPTELQAYIRGKGLDTRLPLVANYGGAMVNVSFQDALAADGEVKFFAPVFKGVEYRHAKPIGDYLRAFIDQEPQGISDRVMFSCNCILNYLHSGLEGKRTAGFTGPITFGEVGYQLLNQTAVYIEIVTANLAERLRAETALRRHNLLMDTLMDTIPDPVFYKGVDGRLLGCNKAYEAFAGLPADKILGRTVRDIFPPDLADAYEAKNSELLSAPGSLSYELKIRDKTGEPRNVVVNSATFSAAGGVVGGVVGVIRDVTELRRTSDDLKLFRDLIESTTDAVMILDPRDGRFLDVNVSACESLGYSKPELLKKRFPEVCAGLPPDYDWSGEVEKVKAVPALLLPITHLRKDGATFPAEANEKHAVLGGKEYLVVIMRDVTERKRMEAAVREVSTLQGLIPICAGCKKIRNDKGYWERVESYISQRSKAQFTHGLCEACVAKLYGNEAWYKEQK